MLSKQGLRLLVFVNENIETSKSVEIEFNAPVFGLGMAFTLAFHSFAMGNTKRESTISRGLEKKNFFGSLHKWLITISSSFWLTMPFFQWWKFVWECFFDYFLQANFGGNLHEHFKSASVVHIPTTLPPPASTPTITTILSEIETFTEFNRSAPLSTLSM